MSRKPKFNPEIKQVKLNPEQAVLNCSCYMNSTSGPGSRVYAWNRGWSTICSGSRTTSLIRFCELWMGPVNSDGILDYIPSAFQS